MGGHPHVDVVGDCRAIAGSGVQSLFADGACQAVLTGVLL